jgi:hypothetical protein
VSLFFDKLTFVWRHINSHHFIAREILLPCRQDIANCPHFKTNEFSPKNLALILVLYFHQGWSIPAVHFSHVISRNRTDLEDQVMEEGGLFRLRNVTIVASFYYLILLTLLHVSVVRPSSGRNILVRITHWQRIRCFKNIVNIIVIGLIVGCLADVVPIMGDVFILVYNFMCR